MEPIDVAKFLNREEGWEKECERAFQVIRDTGILILKDPRVGFEDNEAFLDMLEQYYDQPEEIKLQDVRRDLKYQVGVTPGFVEEPRDHSDRIKAYPEEQRPHVPEGKDPKWRFHWRIGERPQHTEFEELNADTTQVIPKAFEDRWARIMDMWGNHMVQTGRTVAQMLAVGCGLPEDSFSKLLDYGPHLLASTGSDIGKYHEVDTVLAGFHYDLNFLTLHGKGRFPGLFVWTKDGEKMPVRVPEGCLLCQAAKQLEWLTGGAIEAGFHEVVVAESTLQALERAREAGRPLWRVSSTCFTHVASDQVLEPLGPFATEQALAKYPPTKAGTQVREELEIIKTV